VTMVPVGFHGESVVALVVGCGAVGTRRALALLNAGARVTVVSPEISDEIEERSGSDPRLTIERREYSGGDDLRDSNLVVAATESAIVNARVAADARLTGRPVNVADAPGKGTFDFMAAHRVGSITVGVSAGGVPAAATRIRDSIAERVDSRYGDAVTDLTALRRGILASLGADDWRHASNELIDESFCISVESGTFAKKLAEWR
jgi:precorrin-2 dehydrogenase/sirohydrochlorin ferrochelatase